MNEINDLLSLLDASPTPQHAVSAVAERLLAAGAAEESLKEPYVRAPGRMGFVRVDGSIFAWREGTEPATRAGFRVVAAHTDSPNLRIKPQPILSDKGYIRLGLDVYGGAQIATWADRDLGLAGAVHVRARGGVETRLVSVRRPIARIPTLAIHLNRAVNEDGLKFNPQTQLPALFSLGEAPKGSDPLRAMLAEAASCEQSDVITWDLSLFDLTPAALGGAKQEFVFSARLDNLASCHAATLALLSAPPSPQTQVVALFDHEEIGSKTTRGADSRAIETILARLLPASSAPNDLDAALARTWLVSADMAHALHPSFSDKSEPEHAPKLGMGPAIKLNVNQRYTSEGSTAAAFVLLCERAEVPWQWYVHRSDMACGSTVGPMLASRLSVRSVDVGNPMLSMHSAREQCSAEDHPRMIKVMGRFFSDPLPE